ncbi:endonuclease domain-containing protein [Labedella endophytica]|uniref:DUF559 domain-containing protein n=1 Tax=Labedella endophytica TaxID=1523160 RepID=A0A3S0XBC4_9MICO|nr:DUF559 domain-containing protein [Labedella endophytica]
MTVVHGPGARRPSPDRRRCTSMVRRFRESPCMRSRPLPDPLAHAPFSVTEALAQGVSRGRLRSSDLHAPHWGVRATEESRTLEDACREFIPRMPDNALFSHSTAARVHGLPLPARCLGVGLHVGTPYGRRPVDAAGVLGHRMHLTPPDRTRVDGIPVTTVERTWTDLAALLTLPELVAAGDVLVRGWGEAAWHTVAELIEHHPRRRGRPRARQALSLLDGRSESPMESRLRVLLVEGGFTRFRPNFDIRGIGGRFIARGDLVDVEHRLVLEYEGDHHRTDAAQWHRDVRRTVELEDAGWRVIRVTRSGLRDPSHIYTSIHAHYRRGRR